MTDNNSRHLQLNEAKWDKWADTLDKKNWRNEYLRNAQSQVISLLNLQAGVHFLDIGCGTGWAVGQVGKLVNDEGLFYGVDLSVKMIEKAKSNFSAREHLVFKQANVESIPLDSDFFDIIICTNSFHHYPNPVKALDEMNRLLRSGGTVYILDPTADSVLVKFIDKIIRMVEPEHVKMYSSKEFQELFAGAGLKYLSTNIMNGRDTIHIAQK